MRARLAIARCPGALAAGLLLWAGLAAAQGAASSAPPLPYRDVAAALAGLQARDGNGTVVTHADGWTVVNEPLASAQWSFTPPGHAAHPAVVRRTILRQPGGAVQVVVDSLCEGPEPACQQLRAEFEALNDRIVQATRARSRQPSLPAPPASAP